MITSQVRRFLAVLVRFHRGRADMRRLSRLNDRLLRDIGLERADLGDLPGGRDESIRAALEDKGGRRARPASAPLRYCGWIGIG